jgi:hypothetical protein
MTSAYTIELIDRYRESRRIILKGIEMLTTAESASYGIVPHLIPPADLKHETVWEISINIIDMRIEELEELIKNGNN